MVSSTIQNRAERNSEGSAARATQPGCEPELSVLNDLQCYTRKYIQQPETASLICLGIGFLLGWKLKPW